MPSSLKLTDKLARFPVAYGYQPVRGWAVKDIEVAIGQQTQITKQNALAEGPWDGVEKLWSDAFEILPADYVFHPGVSTDPPDAFWPDEEAHLWTAWISARCQAGISPDSAEKLFGIYRTLRTANYDGAGVQIDINGDPVGGGDPRDYYFFKPNPANCAVDQLLRWGQRLPGIVNFPAFVDWRDFNDEDIPWDDSKYTPRSLSLTPAGGGALIPGTTYLVRVATIAHGDLSSASRATSATKPSKITLAVGQTKFQVNWLIKGDEENPVAPPVDIDSYRVYLGHMAGAAEVWDGYADVAGGPSRNFMVTTLAGLTAGVPPDMAAAGLLRQIKRFECGLYFIPPYSLGMALDRICQISCADWQWSGLGTETYRNDKVRFLSPATREPVFTLDLAQVAPGSFKTWPVDRRNRYNQIIGSFRDRDDKYLNEGEPVILDRELLQTNDKQTKSFTIDFGTCFRSQVQRGVSFWARVLCDLDQMAEMRGSPKTYHMLPGDITLVTNDTPDWTDIEFIVQRKKENVENNIGDTFTLRIYAGDAYSDDNFEPLPNPLPAPKINPFAVPPPAVSVDLVQSTRQLADGTYLPAIQIAVQFDVFSSPQRGRIWMRSPKDELEITGFNSGLNRVTAPGHNYEIGDPIGFRVVGGTLPPELNDTDVFFVGPISNVGAGYFQVSATPGGPAIDFSTNGSVVIMVGEFFPTEPVLVPEPSTLRSLTELVGVEIGEYRILVNTESFFGVAGSLENAAKDSILIAIPQMSDPTNFEAFFDGPTGDSHIVWTGLTNESETYELQIRDEADTTWKRLLNIKPALNANLQEYVIWSPLGFGEGTLLESGGVDNLATGVNGTVSQAGAEVVGGLLIQFEAPPDGAPMPDYMSIFPDWSYGYSLDFAFMWVCRDQSGPPWYRGMGDNRYGLYPEGNPADGFPADPESHEAFRQKLVSGRSYDIYIRPDGIAEYHVNFSPFSRPVFTSGRVVDMAALYRAYMGTANVIGSVRRVQWSRQGPEWKYIVAAQKIDNTGSLPASFKARVRQMSPFGAHSNWVEETFVR